MAWRKTGAAPLLRQTASNLLLDRIARCDAFDGLITINGPLGSQQIEELAPDVRHAARFPARAVFINLVEAGQSFGMQTSKQVDEVLLSHKKEKPLRNAIAGSSGYM